MNFFIRGAIFSSVIFAVAAASFFSGCGAEINPDFKGFIENELRKVHTMTYSVVAVRVTLPPYKTVYETGDSVWVPVNPANPEDGIEAAVTIGGGTVYAYYFESFDDKANILTMKGEDGKTLSFRVEGFDTSKANPSAELRLVALDAEGGELKVPVLPDDYRWKFEREGEALSSALSYKVVSAGGLSGEIGVKGYSGRFGGVYAKVNRADLGDTVYGEVWAAPGYRLKEGTLTCSGKYVETRPVFDVGKEWWVEASGGLVYPFSFRITSANMSVLCDIELSAGFEMEGYKMTLPALSPVSGGKVVAVEVNGERFPASGEAGWSGVFPRELRMGDGVKLFMKAESGWLLAAGGVSYTSARFNKSVAVSCGYERDDVLPGDSSAFFSVPASDVAVEVNFEDSTISFITLEEKHGGSPPDKLKYDIYEKFDSEGIVVVGVMIDRYSTKVDLTAEVDLTEESEIKPSGVNSEGEFTEPGKWDVVVRARGKTVVFTVEVSADGKAAVREEGGSRIFYTTLQSAVDAAKAAGSGAGPQTISLIANVTISNNGEAPIEIPAGLDVEINSLGGSRLVQRGASGGGELFRVGDGAALTLSGGVGALTVSGGAAWAGANPGSGVNSGFTAGGPLVKVENGGVFTLKEGAVLRDNDNAGNGGGGVYSDFEGTFNMKGGLITGCYGAEGGGAFLNGGAFNMTGGNISGNGASSGGGVCFNNGVFDISGGSILSNNASSSGGGIYVNGGSFSISDGVVYGNTAAAGSGVYVAAGGVSMSGEAVIAANNDVHLTGEACITVSGPLQAQKAAVVTPYLYDDEDHVFVDVSGLPGGAAAQLKKFSLTPDSSGEIYFFNRADGKQGKIASAFFSRAENGLTVYYGEDLNLALNEAPGQEAVVTVLRDADAGAFDVLKTAVLKPAAGKAVKLKASFTINSGGAVRLEGSQGGTLTLTAVSKDNKAVVVNSGGALILADGAVISGETGADGKPAQRNKALVTIESGGVFRMAGGVVKNMKSLAESPVVNKGVFFMEGGEISGDTGASGGAIYNNRGTFTMSGGKILNNTGELGGGIYNEGGTFTFSGGEISGNHTSGSSNNGGGVYNQNGTFTMSGAASISGNTGGAGGGVYNTGGNFMFSGGEISDNTATGNGGGVYNESGDFTFSGGSISENTASGASGYGGGVYNKGDFKFSGGSISENNAETGGGVFNWDSGTFTFSGGSIAENNADGGGGVYNSGTFTFSGGASISGNTSINDGGGVYNYGRTFTMSGGSISGNNSGGYGAGVFNSSGTFTFSGGCISENTAIGGGGVSNSSGTFTMTGGEISENNASGGNGGGVYNYGGGFTMSGGEISENEASGDGGGVYNYSGTFTFSGGSISKNTASGDNGGGGVYNDGPFTFSGGSISENNATRGGGVYNGAGRTFTFSGGEISENEASGDGGGVYNKGIFNMSDAASISYNNANGGGGIFNNSGTFTFSGGSISYNNAARGGGIYSAVSNSACIMSGDSIISHNTATVNGGGVYNNSGTFTFSGGSISYNNAATGGGVFNVGESGAFIMSGGSISGNTATENGGVSNGKDTTFTMSGGSISGNTPTDY